MVTPSDFERPAAYAHRIALFAMGGLILLQPLWHAVLAPPRIGSPAMAAALAILPWLPVVLATWNNPRRGVLWGGALALFYFSHGVAAAWSGLGTERLLALIEVLLTMLLIVPPGTVAWRERRALRVAAR